MPESDLSAERIPRRHRIILGLILLMEIALLTYMTWRWGVQHLDSDDSAEMILSELLSRTGGILTKNWFYSTEIRVLNTQLVMSVLFRFIDDWHVVRTAGTAILLTILVFSYIFLCRSTRLGNTLIYFSPLIVWPFSETYYDFVLYGLYYIPHLSIIFVTLGLTLYPGRRRKVLCLAALLLLSFAAGLGGIRILAVCYVPLLFASVLSVIPFLKAKSGTARSVTLRTVSAAVSCGLGYLVNVEFLAKRYSFVSARDTKLVLPRPDRIKTAVKSTLSALGAAPDRGSALSAAAVLLTALMLAVLLFMFLRLLGKWRTLSQDEQVLLLYFALSLCATAAICVLTTMTWKARYMLLPCIGFLAVPAVYFRKFPVCMPASKAVCMIILAAELLTGIHQFHNFTTENKLQRQSAAYEYILNSDMEFGFGDWDASDVLTELSDGRIHMCKLCELSKPRAWYWLMEKDFKRYAESGPVFLLLDNSRLSFHGNIGHLFGNWEKEDLKYLSEGTIVYQDPNYTVWRYDSLERFEAAAGRGP